MAKNELDEALELVDSEIKKIGIKATTDINNG